MDEGTAIHWILGIVGALITGLSGWSWIDMNRKVNEKADKEELEILRNDLRARWEQQDRRHAENTRRLDRILEGIAHIRNNQ